MLSFVTKPFMYLRFDARSRENVCRDWLICWAYGSLSIEVVISCRPMCPFSVKTKMPLWRTCRVHYSFSAQVVICDRIMRFLGAWSHTQEMCTAQRNSAVGLLRQAKLLHCSTEVRAIACGPVSAAARLLMTNRSCYAESRERNLQDPKDMLLLGPPMRPLHALTRT